MKFTDILGLFLSLPGICGPILFILSQLPRSVAPRLSTLLEDTSHLLHRAEDVGAVPLQGELKGRLGR